MLDKKDTRVITVHVPERTFRKLKMISAALDKSNAEIIAEAIDKLDVQVMKVRIERRPARKKASEPGDVDWIEMLTPGPGEWSIVEPWKATSENRQVEPDLSKTSKSKRGGR
jgi:hypothetical protein